MEECKNGLFDFALRLRDGIGPVVIARPGFAATELGAVSLDGLVQTKNLSTFVVHEALAREDIDQSGDFGEDVVVVQDRESGQKLPLAADTHEGRGSVPGRPVARVRESPFSFYAVAAQDPADGSDGDVLAFLEPEGPHDINGDGDTIDTILRTFVRRGRDGGLESRTPIIAADAAPVVNGRSFALSKGMIFARISEAAGAPHRTTRISVSHSGGDADAASLHGVVAGNGRFVAFASDATNLTIDPEVPGTRDVFAVAAVIVRGALGTGTGVATAVGTHAPHAASV